MPSSLQDLSSLTRDRTWDLAVKAMSPKHWISRNFPYHHFYLHVHTSLDSTLCDALFPWDSLSCSLESISYPDTASLSSLSTPSCHVSSPLTELLLSSLSGLSSKTLSSTARTAHRDPGAARSCRSTSDPGSCWEGEKPRETWGREKDNMGIRSGWRGGEIAISHMP